MASGTPSTAQLARMLATLAAMSALLYVVYLARSVVGLVAISVFLAMALAPAVNLLARRRVPRSLAIIVVYLAIFAAIVGVGSLFVPPLVSGVNSVQHDAPKYIHKLRRNAVFRQYDNRFKITAKILQEAKNLPRQLSKLSGTLASVTVGVFSAIFNLIIVLTITFFLLLEGERLVSGALRTLFPARAAALEPAAREIYRTVNGYVAGNLAISVIAGVVALVTMLILNLPFVVPLAVMMAFFDLIPLVGATIGAVIIGVVTLFVGFPTTTIVWAIVQVVYQQVESSVLVPVIYRRTVHVSGLLTIVAVLVGAQLLGILGALVAIPVAGAIQIAAQQIWRAYRHPALVTTSDSAGG